MIVASWNVNGLRAAVQKGLHDRVAELAPDVLLLQEIKGSIHDLPRAAVEIDGYAAHVHGAKRRGYSGVGIWSKREPDEWIDGVGDPRFDDEGRLCFARFGDVVVGSVYVPNSQPGGRRLDYRLAFNRALVERLDAFRAEGLMVVVGGDFNVAHAPIDLARPKQNEKNPGYLPEERAWMTEFLADGWIDTWRRRNPDVADVYSWWTYRFQARQKNIGWRLDYVIVDEAHDARVLDAGIRTEIEGSDHCPVTVTIRP